MAKMLELDPFSYVLVPSAFGNFGIVWRETEQGPRVYRVLLPNEQVLTQDVVQVILSDASSLVPPAIAELYERLRCFLEGDAVDFELNLVALETCSKFQTSVLLAEHEIPRGWVSTYGRVAKSLGVPGGARAVGGALGRNPFPIIIPCHRAIRADGQLGGFRGGLKMKRGLLEMEGLEVGETGKVLTDRFYY